MDCPCAFSGLSTARCWVLFKQYHGGISGGLSFMCALFWKGHACGTSLTLFTEVIMTTEGVSSCIVMAM